MTDQELKELLKPYKLKIDKLEWDISLYPEFPLDLISPEDKYNKNYYSYYWNDGELERNWREDRVIGEWNTIDDYNYASIISNAINWEVKHIIIGFDKANDRFFVVGFC